MTKEDNLTKVFKGSNNLFILNQKCSSAPYLTQIKVVRPNLWHKFKTKTCKYFKKNNLVVENTTM